MRLEYPQVPASAGAAAGEAPDPYAAEYRATLTPGHFHVSEADAESGTVSVDTAAAFRLFKGAATLYPVDQEDLELRVPEGGAWPAAPEALTLDIVFRPGQNHRDPVHRGVVAR